MGFDTHHWRMAHNPVDIYATSEPYNLTLDGSGLLTVHNCGSENNIRVGDSYILRHQVYSLNGFSFQNCSDVELQGVQLFSIPGGYCLTAQEIPNTSPLQQCSCCPGRQASEDSTDPVLAVLTTIVSCRNGVLHGPSPQCTFKRLRGAPAVWSTDVHHRGRVAFQRMLGSPAFGRSSHGGAGE